MNYFKRALFAIGMILRNIIKLVFGLLGMVFHFVSSMFTYLLVIGGWYNNIEGKKLTKREFNPIGPIVFFENYFHLK